MRSSDGTMLTALDNKADRVVEASGDRAGGATEDVGVIVLLEEGAPVPIVVDL